MAIYRGPGGAGDATTDSSTEAAAALAAAAEAEVSATSAANSATSASNSATTATTQATNASNSATAAASSASAASTSASNASTSATNAASSATTATTKASEAASSATAAASSASAASTSATNAASSASAASTSATNAASSATSAANSATTATTQATNASNSATAAASSATSAASSASTATTQATNASNSATAAATSATNAATSETNAANSATSASTSATNAANSASAASTSATNASNSASAASTSATNAASSATSAASSATAAAASYDSFDDRYLGAKSSAPTLDNDGNTLLVGALYFNTVSNFMKVWDGSSWLDAYASLSGALLAANNLSDLANVATARTNLGLGTAALVADNTLVHLAGTETITGAKTFSSTITGSISGNAGTVTNGVYTTGDQTIGGTKTFSSTITGSISGNAGTVTNGVYTSGSYADPTWLTSIAGSKVSGNISGNAATATTATNQSGGTVAATTLSASSTVTLSGGTANGVAYLNGSKVLTTGSALTFDGTNLGVGTTSPSKKFVVSDSNAIGIELSPNDAGSSTSRIFAYNRTTPGYTALRVQGSELYFDAGGSEQMRLNSTGLGIGTSSPSAKLHVSGANTAEIIEDTGTSYAYSNYKNTGSYMFVGQERSAGGALASGSSAYAGIIATQAAYPLQLGTNGTVRATLDSSGNLGLGVTPSAWSGGPAYEMKGGSFWANATNGAYLLQNAYYNGTNWIYKTSSQASYYLQGTGTHAWYTAPSGTAGNAISFTQAMTLDASGNLAIGQTSASYKLDVNGEINLADNQALRSAGALLLRRNATSHEIRIGSGDPSDYLALYTGAAERMRIDSSGNVGIGTSSPSSYGRKLLVNGTGGFNNDSGTVGIGFSKGASTIYGYIGTGDWAINGLSAADFGISSGATGALVFGTNFTERMRIDSSGNVGIGTSSPGQRLDLGGGSLTLSNSTGTQQIYLYRFSATNYSSIGTDSSSGGITFTTGTSSPTERMRIDSSGNVGIGTSSPSGAQLHVSTSSITSIKVESSGVGQNAQFKTKSTVREWYFGQNIVETSTGSFEFYDATAAAARMSIDTSGNLKFNSGYGSAATAYGCRAWVNFNGTGTVAIRASGNVSSITDNGTGDYTVNFSTAMPDANYAVSGFAAFDSSTDNNVYCVGQKGSISSNYTASLCRLQIRRVDSVDSDINIVCAQFFR